MSTNATASVSKTLERNRVALTNAETHPIISKLISEFGMDSARIAIGREKLNTANAALEHSNKEVVETKLSSNTYKNSYRELQALFKRHRDQSLILFKKHPDYLIKLGIKGRFPAKYTEFFDKTKEYYQALQNNPDIQEKLNLCKITADVVSACLEKREKLMIERANYDKEAGESQDATDVKNAALLDLKEWMEDFDIVAKIALYDHPQLLEVLGIFVRN